MGTRLRVSVVAPSAEVGATAIEAAFAEVRRLEAVLSSWREDSELGRLNEAEPGVPVSASAELLEARVIRYRRQHCHCRQEVDTIG